MSGDRLIVDLDALGEISARLVQLREEFEQSSEFADAGDIVGSDGIADALNEFGNNWKWHRRKLTDKITAVQEMAADSKIAYERVDLDLASAVRGEKESP